VKNIINIIMYIGRYSRNLRDRKIIRRKSLFFGQITCEKRPETTGEGRWKIKMPLCVRYNIYVFVWVCVCLHNIIAVGRIIIFRPTRRREESCSRALFFRLRLNEVNRTIIIMMIIIFFRHRNIILLFYCVVVIIYYIIIIIS